MAMPPHEPTEFLRKQVMILAALGKSQEKSKDGDSETISSLLNIDPKTLRKYYRHELDQGTNIATLKVASVLFDLCLEGDMKAISLWLKTRSGGLFSEQKEDAKDTVIEQLIKQLATSSK